jgi:hypothetical protein
MGAREGVDGRKDAEGIEVQEERGVTTWLRDANDAAGGVPNKRLS